jgi:hypothetical protein
MNRDINIILTTAETLVTAIDFVEGLGRIRKGVAADSVQYTFPWKKLGAVSISPAAAGTAGIVTITPGALAANTTYSFFLTQDMELMFEETAVEQITWTSGAIAPTAIEICNGWRDVVLSHVNAGRLAITVPAAGAATLILPAASVDNFNLRGVSGTLGTAVQTAAPVAPVGRGADLLAEGIVDSFPAVGAVAALPVAGLSYSEFTFELMMPKGNGGFNEQTSDQAVSLKVYADEGAAGWAALDAVVDTIIDGTYTAAELLGSDV